MISRHLRIHGRVQGVWFRASMAEQAQQAGITGWVRNRSDGSVEAMVQGTPDQIATMIVWAQHGPPRAQVTGVEVRETAAEALTGFEQRETL